MLVLLFFVFAVAGWLMEVSLKYIQYHRFINRGFLIGPYCPIYGWGVIVVTVVVGGLIGREGTIGETFLAGIIICGALEYFTSWYMEKVFHARWWDYSTKPMNLHGRIWIGNLILFGLGSVIIIRWVDPHLLHMVSTWPKFVIEILAGAVLILFLTDYVVSHFLMNSVKQSIDNQEGDNTEEISKGVRELLQNRSLLIRRVHEAYPEWTPRPKRLMKELHDAREQYKAAAKQLKEDLKMTTKKVDTVYWSERLEGSRLTYKAAKQKLKGIEKRLFDKKDEKE